MRPLAVLLLSLLILAGAAWLRPPEYDEAYSIFLTAGDPRPAWPQQVFRPADVRSFYRGDASPTSIARSLRSGDVHPPLYFWLLEYWRRIAGSGWFAARMLSVLCSVGALASLAWLATLAEIPPTPAMLFALLSYGFAYTGIVARGFALAQALNILGMALSLSATRHAAHPRGRGLAAGLAFGAAGCTNYLAVFPGLAALFWLGLERRRRRVLAPAAIGFAVFLPVMLAFFLAQRHARIGQFQAFAWRPAIARLAKDLGGAWFGGLPVYAGPAGGAVAAALAVLAAICAGFIVKNWRPKYALFGLAALSVPAGLLALGLIFNNTPIEIRYLAFAIPYLALLLAAALPPALRYPLLAIQSCGIIGLVYAHATMQPQALAAAQIARLNMPTALILLPFGNDGVGVPGPFIAAAPDDSRIELIRPGPQPDLANEQSIILAVIRADDASRQASTRMLARLDADPCWKQLPSGSLLKTFVRACGTH